VIVARPQARSGRAIRIKLHGKTWDRLPCGWAPEASSDGFGDRIDVSRPSAEEIRKFFGISRVTLGQAEKHHILRKN
jgi:hypothetical protein